MRTKVYHSLGYPAGPYRAVFSRKPLRDLAVCGRYHPRAPPVYTLAGDLQNLTRPDPRGTSAPQLML